MLREDIDEGGGFRDGTFRREQDFFTSDDTEGVTPDLLEFIANGPKVMTQALYRGIPIPALLARVHWWFKETYEHESFLFGLCM